MKIGIIAFGSVATQLSSPHYGSLEIEGQFMYPPKSELSLPIRMARHSSKGDPENARLTLVVHPDASPECVAVAKSARLTLEEVVNSLAQREGTTTKNISYMTSKPFSLFEVPQDSITVDGVQYQGRFSGINKEFSLKDHQATIIARWLKSSGFEAVVWTGLPPNIDTAKGEIGNRGREILGYLKNSNSPKLLENTQQYITNLNENFQTPLLKRILAGNLEDVSQSQTSTRSSNNYSSHHKTCMIM